MSQSSAATQLQTSGSPSPRTHAAAAAADDALESEDIDSTEAAAPNSSSSEAAAPSSSSSSSSLLACQIGTEREHTRALLAQLESRLRAEFEEKLLRRLHSTASSGHPPASVVVDSIHWRSPDAAEHSAAVASHPSSSHCASCAHQSSSGSRHLHVAPKKRSFLSNFTCCTGCMILLPLLVIGLSTLLYASRSHIAWFQQTQAWLVKAQRRWDDRPHPILKAKSTAQKVSQQAVNGYTGLVERTKTYLPERAYRDSSGTIWVPLAQTPGGKVDVPAAAFATAPPPA
jgi:hypothetical protein